MPPKFGMFLLAISQTLHSLEEYYHSLWEVFAPARFASNLVSDDPATGFITLNASIVALAFWTCFIPVMRNWASAKAFLWFWIVLELANGIAHIALAVSAKGYFPGAYSAPLLVVVSCYLAFKLLQRSHESAAA